MFWKKKPAAPHPDEELLRRLSGAAMLIKELESTVSGKNADIDGLRSRVDELVQLLSKQPWAPRNKGVSGGAFHSDTGADSSWESLDERAETEASAFRHHPGYRAMLDILESRLLGIWRRWKSTDDPAEITSLHTHARCYEDMIATLDNKTSMKDRKEMQARLEAKAGMERERNAHMATVGRSPFLR